MTTSFSIEIIQLLVNISNQERQLRIQVIAKYV